MIPRVDHECDSTAAPYVESIQNKFETCKAAELSTAFDLSLTHSFGVNLNSGPRNLASRNWKDRSIVRCQHIYIRLFRFVRVHAFNGRTDRQTDVDSNSARYQSWMRAKNFEVVRPNCYQRTDHFQRL